jgi:hypothetical protein
MATVQTTEEQLAAKAKEDALAKAKADAKATNDSRTGKGTRVQIGSTRGRNTQVISYEAFDQSLTGTLPTTLSEFMDLVTKDESAIVKYLVEGFNAVSYETASDPIAEFVEQSWPDDVQKQFRFAIRNYSQGVGVSIEDAVNLIKPGFVAAQAKK